MSQQDVTPVSVGTGTFVVLGENSARSRATESGNNIPETGKGVPVAEPTKPDLREIAISLNRASRSIGRDLHFEVNLQSGRSVIQVLDRETGEIIRQIPPEKAQLLLSGNNAGRLTLFDDRV